MNFEEFHRGLSKAVRAARAAGAPAGCVQAVADAAMRAWRSEHAGESAPVAVEQEHEHDHCTADPFDSPSRN